MRKLCRMCLKVILTQDTMTGRVKKNNCWLLTWFLASSFLWRGCFETSGSSRRSRERILNLIGEFHLDLLMIVESHINSRRSRVSEMTSPSWASLAKRFGVWCTFWFDLRHEVWFPPRIMNSSRIDFSHKRRFGAKRKKFRSCRRCDRKKSMKIELLRLKIIGKNTRSAFQRLLSQSIDFRKPEFFAFKEGSLAVEEGLG